MELVHDYRERAAYAERRAAGARDADTKRRLLEVAATWRTMASQAERFGRRFLFHAKADSRLFIDFEDPFIPLDHQRAEAGQPSVESQRATRVRAHLSERSRSLNQRLPITPDWA